MRHAQLSDILSLSSLRTYHSIVHASIPRSSSL
jgi:hypothetical protein